MRQSKLASHDIDPVDYLRGMSVLKRTQNAPGGPVGARQPELVVALGKRLLTGQSITQVAINLGISRRYVHRWATRLGFRSSREAGLGLGKNGWVTRYMGPQRMKRKGKNND